MQEKVLYHRKRIFSRAYKSDQEKSLYCFMDFFPGGNDRISSTCEIMPYCNPDDDGKKTTAPPDPSPDLNQDLPVNMTLEDIIDLTGEIEHLNELVMLSLQRDGGFTGTEAYFATVQPILDLLEVEIRLRCRAGMSRTELKLVIQDWIDSEIRSLP